MQESQLTYLKIWYNLQLKYKTNLSKHMKNENKKNMVWAQYVAYK